MKYRNKRNLETEYHRLSCRIPFPLLAVIAKIEDRELCIGANQAIIEALKFYDKATTKITPPKPSNLIH